MKRRIVVNSQKGKLVSNKLDPGVFVVEIPEKNRRISLGQPPDVVKRLQQVGYYGSNAVNTFVLVDSKIQDDSICWVLVEFPVLYALYLCLVEAEGKMVPAFYAGVYPTLVGIEPDIQKALKMIKYGNYGFDSLDELDEMDIPEATKRALKTEILGLAVGNEIKDSHSFINSVYLESNPRNANEFSDIGDGITIGRLAYNLYRIFYGDDYLDIDVSLTADESFRAPVEYKHLKFPITNFGIWHTGEYDGMDPYFSCAHTTIIHKYEPILIDYPSNMTDIINHNGLSKQSIHHIIVTHNHDDHIGAVVELFRRNTPCHIITTEPVKHSVIKKIASLIDLPEMLVENSFCWTILKFRADNPYQTETYNLEGIKITGHLSCHSVPTTVYTFEIGLEGHCYTYGHFLDIVAFKRMATMVKDGWMPQDHLNHLDAVIRKQSYNLLKYDCGCATDASLPFTVHGQWQDLRSAKTERSFRVFTHVTKSLLGKEYENEGRFVSVGDLDSAIRLPNGPLVNFGEGLAPVIPYFYQAYHLILEYFKSLIGHSLDANTEANMHHYAFVFANTPTQTNPNIGTFMIEQGAVSDSVYIIVKGRAEFMTFSDQGDLISRSSVGDGEVMGDIGVLAQQPRMASVKTLNRLRYLRISGASFSEAMEALNINYEGNFKKMFDRRLLFQSATEISQDVSTTVLNRIANHSKTYRVKKGDAIITKGERDQRLLVVNGPVTIEVDSDTLGLDGPDIVGECEMFLREVSKNDRRLHSVKATEEIDVLEIDTEMVKGVPVIIDNIRRVIRNRRRTIYQHLPDIDQTL